ncbi:DUF805 domain-containing protein [Macrococcus carouselicus]|uniref:DUF805 domain-containing protein n=1 Tax=Macrococcus carouselicus TaxID=69969 RepID=A0A9Q8CKR6_9STAP|nr:DUF805 domain-containing protein [Macrococcus carouselicus]TDL96603.1 DUF805 domain-containing protein [Macrococcus carouselicus]
MMTEMTYLEAYKQFWTEAFNLHDRARRKAFWVPFAVHAVFYLTFSILILIFYQTSYNHVYQTLNFLYNVTLSVPTFSVIYRRLQDMNMTGWLALILPVLYFIIDLPEEYVNETMQLIVWFLYLICGIILLVILTFDGTEGPNRFSYDPKESIDELNPRNY